MAAARALAAHWGATRRDLVRLGVFGSYARGDAGVGSDLDLIAIIRHSEQPFERRAAEWDLTSLPVPAEIVVYTEAEWQRLKQRGGRFARMISEQAVWLVRRG